MTPVIVPIKGDDCGERVERALEIDVEGFFFRDEICVTLFYNAAEQSLFAAEIIIEHAVVAARGATNPIDSRAAIPFGGKFRDRGAQDRISSVFR